MPREHRSTAKVPYRSVIKIMPVGGRQARGGGIAGVRLGPAQAVAEVSRPDGLEARAGGVGGALFELVGPAVGQPVDRPRAPAPLEAHRHLARLGPGVEEGRQPGRRLRRRDHPALDHLIAGGWAVDHPGELRAAAGPQLGEEETAEGEEGEGANRHGGEDFGGLLQRILPRLVRDRVSSALAFIVGIAVDAGENWTYIDYE